MRVDRLQLNTKYRFRVRAKLVDASTSTNVEFGDWSGNSALIKTSCIPPDPPTITDITAGIDEFSNRATFTVFWDVSVVNGFATMYPKVSCMLL